jgi:hypothetical protein
MSQLRPTRRNSQIKGSTDRFVVVEDQVQSTSTDSRRNFIKEKKCQIFELDF